MSVKDFFTDYPYTIHTNQELALMLRGEKPMAKFTHERVEGFEKSHALAGQDFESHVKLGTILAFKRTRDYELQIDCRAGAKGDLIKIDHYFYTLPGEEWRVEAYWLLIKRRSKGEWCAHMERLEGELLGYGDIQNDYHINERYIPNMLERRGGKKRNCGCEV